MTINELLHLCVEKKASDLHLSSGHPIQFRVDGDLQSLYKDSLLSHEDVRELVYTTLREDDVERLEHEGQVDFAYGIEGLGRFRGNAFYFCHGLLGAIYRHIPPAPPSVEQLGLPPIIKELTKRSRGLILVTGPTGSGKSTTLASMIYEINKERPLHILTIEDPIEYLHTNIRASIHQRQIGIDTPSFASAMRHALRQDPDVILVGEMRDLETISMALTAAETGHLVLATLHTTGAVNSIDRIIDVFPGEQQQQVRIQLSQILEAVISQLLLPKQGGGRMLAMEIMLGNPAIKNLIREKKTHQIGTNIQMSSQIGMQSLNMSLASLIRAGDIDLDTALSASMDQDELRQILAALENKISDKRTVSRM